MELRSVAYLLAVAEHGSLSAAAGALGLSQPALTKAIRRIEAEWGATLFERGARGVRPTAAGEALLRHARNLGATLREARRDLDSLRRGERGWVRLGAGPSWQGTLLPEAIAAFRAARPQLRIQVVGGLDAALKGALQAGELDFVLAAVGDVAAESSPELAQRVLMHDRYRVVAASAHPLHAAGAVGLADLLDYPWILPPAGTYMVERLRATFRARGLAPPEPAVETDSHPLRFALMRGGPYLSFQAEGHLAALAVPDILTLDVEGIAWGRGSGIITRRAVEPSPGAAALIAVIERVAAERAGLPVPRVSIG